MGLLNRTDLVRCRECGGEISSQANVCPHCGANQPVNQTSTESQPMAALHERKLVECPGCAGKVSPDAIMCPHCGQPLKKVPFGYYGGKVGGEYKSKTMINGRPLWHVAWGRDPNTGKMRVANGIFALGQFAKGEFAVGQFAYGRFFALGQFAASWGVGIGQFAIAPFCVGMFGIGLFTTALFGIGLLKVISLFGWSPLDGVVFPPPDAGAPPPMPAPPGTPAPTGG